MPSIDRRVQRTRAALHHALVALSAERPFEQLTVEEICAAANVGRSTFYAHYKSKDDLKRSAIDERLRQLFHARRGEAHAPVTATRVVFEHVREYMDFCRAALCGASDRLALEAIEASVSEMMRRERRGASAGGDPALREASLQYAVGGFMAILMAWIKGGAKRSPEEMEALFRQVSGSDSPPG